MSGCAAGSSGSASAWDSLVIGTTSALGPLDPAAPRGQGSSPVAAQVFSSLLTTEPGSNELVPDLASSAVFSGPKQFTVTLRPDLTFANGHRLTSSDVVFSFERQIAIHASGGAVPVLDGLATVTARGDRVVVFDLQKADASFARVLATPAAAIVDEQVFSSRTLTDDAAIVGSHAFDGQYTIDSYHAGRLITFVRNGHYAGALGVAATPNISLKYYANAPDLRLDLQGGTVDLAEGIAPADVAMFRNKAYTVVSGPGSEMQYLVFDPRTMPYSASATQSLIVRQAVADLVDRSKLSAALDSGHDLPLYSFVPRGVSGATSPLTRAYGNGHGLPDLNKAAALVQGAQLTTPIVLKVEYNTNVFGSSSKAEFKELKDELELGGLFTVVLDKADFPKYDHDRRAGMYPLYQFWTSASLPDAGRSLQQTFGTGVLSPPAGDTSITDRITAQGGELDAAKRQADLSDIQKLLTAALPALPLLQTSQVVVMRSAVTGARLDASQVFRFGDLIKR